MHNVEYGIDWQDNRRLIDTRYMDIADDIVLLACTNQSIS